MSQMNKSKSQSMNIHFNYQNQKDHFQEQNNFQTFIPNIGVIRSQWKNTKGRIQSLCYGTGFAISKRVVITCAHNIFLDRTHKPCDSVSFIPSHSYGRLPENHKVYKSTFFNFLGYQPLPQNLTFNARSLKQDIALIYLSQDLQLNNFPEIGVQQSESVNQYKQLFVSGYPSSDYSRSIKLQQIKYKRVSLKGDLLQIKKHIIFHNMQTKTGHSGSGILGRNKFGEIKLLGVHTHKGQTRNSGVYLNQEIISRLVRYEIQFCLQHKGYDLGIKFPNIIKKREIQNLSQQNRERILQIWSQTLKQQQKQNNQNNKNISQLICCNVASNGDKYKFTNEVNQASQQSDFGEYQLAEEQFLDQYEMLHFSLTPIQLLQLKYGQNRELLQKLNNQKYTKLVTDCFTTINKYLKMLHKLQSNKNKQIFLPCLNIQQKIELMTDQFNSYNQQLQKQLNKMMIPIKISKLLTIQEHLLINKIQYVEQDQVINSLKQSINLSSPHKRSQQNNERQNKVEQFYLTPMI